MGRGRALVRASVCAFLHGARGPEKGGKVATAGGGRPSFSPSRAHWAASARRPAPRFGLAPPFGLLHPRPSPGTHLRLNRQTVAATRFARQSLAGRWRRRWRNCPPWLRKEGRRDSATSVWRAIRGERRRSGRAGRGQRVYRRELAHGVGEAGVRQTTPRRASSPPHRHACVCAGCTGEVARQLTARRPAPPCLLRLSQKLPISAGPATHRPISLPVQHAHSVVRGARIAAGHRDGRALAWKEAARRQRSAAQKFFWGTARPRAGRAPDHAASFRRPPSKGQTVLSPAAHGKRPVSGQAALVVQRDEPSEKSLDRAEG